ncbi:MAG: nitrite/sulfite reductase [Myxococcota bacterium]
MSEVAPTFPLRASIAGARDAVARDLDALEGAITRFERGDTDEASFLEYRLRFGIYGMRQNGVHMIRSKLPLGLLGPDQLEAFADLTERYAGGVAHLTTRQDIQVHFVALRETPDLMRALADAEMTAREACGNVVRNVVASESAGIEPGEAFDITPYGFALARFLLRHPDGQSLGRKFKIALAGTFDPRFNVNPIHDYGATAVVRDGRRGFHVVVGGGLGAVPHEAQLLSAFIPVTELLPMALAVLRVFQRHGEKKKRAKARLKFLVAAWGIERFRAEVNAERARLDGEGADLGHDVLAAALADDYRDHPIHPPGEKMPIARDAEEAAWFRTNVTHQRQTGYAAVRVRVPRGDLDPGQLRALAAMLRTHVGDTMRIAVDQSLFIRHVSLDRLHAVRDALVAAGLGRTRAGGLGDTVTCPGADTCKLGITSPRAIARLIEPTLDALADADPRVEDLTIKISGCPNSCAQHHIADIGFFGAARTVDGHTAPHFMLHVGGVGGGHRHGDDWGTALPVARVPALWVGRVIERLIGQYLSDAAEDESWTSWSRRLGRKALKALVADLTNVPPPAEDPVFYHRVGTDESFAIVRGKGECAGVAVGAAALGLLEADERAEAALSLHEQGRPEPDVADAAVTAMLHAARALLTTQDINVTRSEAVVDAFRVTFVDAGRIYDSVAGYLFTALEEQRADVPKARGPDRLRRLVVEAGLFVEEAHGMIAKMATGVAPPAPPAGATVQLGRRVGATA